MSDLDPIEIVLKGAKDTGLPHGLPDEVAKEYGYEPDAKKGDDPKDVYETLSVAEMVKSFIKTKSLNKALELGLKVSPSWSKKKICEAIYNHFN